VHHPRVNDDATASDRGGAQGIRDAPPLLALRPALREHQPRASPHQQPENRKAEASASQSLLSRAETHRAPPIGGHSAIARDTAARMSSRRRSASRSSDAASSRSALRGSVHSHEPRQQHERESEEAERSAQLARRRSSWRSRIAATRQRALQYRESDRRLPTSSTLHRRLAHGLEAVTPSSRLRVTAHLRPSASRRAPAARSGERTQPCERVDAARSS
jgi:hypothetical protein